MKSIVLQNQNNVSVNVNWILKFLKEETWTNYFFIEMDLFENNISRK